MTEKRFTIKHYESTDWIYDNGKVIHISKVVDLLNAFHEENKQLKQRISELELLNDGLNYALKNIRKIDVKIDVGDFE